MRAETVAVPVGAIPEAVTRFHRRPVTDAFPPPDSSLPEASLKRRYSCAVPLSAQTTAFRV
ncbi:hypothetical protein [Nonomuraea guangzhouensis]|uniref:Uncharacterized protein n=1 Tax=Nonomuraea guangzhouensis TaxID=1291555 RepID=A0ABW4GU87_9ACTN